MAAAAPVASPGGGSGDGRGRHRPFKPVSETTREREAFKSVADVLSPSGNNTMLTHFRLDMTLFLQYDSLSTKPAAPCLALV